MRNLDRISLFFSVNYFAQGMGGIVFEPLSYLLKDGLGLTAGPSARFIAWMTFPFLIKPLSGLLTDLVPLGGYRRRPQLIFYCLAASGAWFFLALQSRISYVPLLIALITANIALVASDVICDAVMVEEGKAKNKTGFYQAVQIGTLYAALVLTGVGGGWLTAHVSVGWIFALSGTFPFLVLLSCWEFPERRVEASGPAWKGLRALVTAKRFWILSLFIFLWSFYPFLGTAQFYYQSQNLNLSPVFIGFLSTLVGVAGIMGAAFYGKFIGGVLNTDSVVRNAVWIGAPLSLLYLFYLGPVSVAAITVVLGFSGVVFRLALMDLAAQSCPEGAEATGFAAYMAVFNLAAWSSNMAGGELYDRLVLAMGGLSDPAYGSIAILILIGTLCTLSCGWLLPYLKA